MKELAYHSSMSLLVVGLHVHYAFFDLVGNKLENDILWF